jgi:hypothetical protein
VFLLQMLLPLLLAALWWQLVCGVQLLSSSSASNPDAFSTAALLCVCTDRLLLY